ncbi:RNA 2',3'-cyclic phosphodiesterase [Methylopila jiangsuensis]|uniref:RNA 2',3'-cyclic phosphodiesterase n=1 Tax=Methylopila jiangsuensis TaxID=586230 RepID=A0A9W6N4X7_9HYPH|nr:RNA 2',3'-cyclic phosphodiesterase [Methylopila jiangsuensis]MDR6284916.1 2'-5' RNA ligase [Methylopila jiangsuensis]GLK77696.1 RNA 2',3'-cyclic phosphodiesterase [Methylopila jiangsuensis]
MPRLFTAIEVPEEVGLILSGYRGGLSGARWIDVENYHITLRFLGDVDEETAQEAAYLLGKVRRAPFEVTFEGPDAFGGARPRSLIVKVAPTPALIELQAEHERLMRRAGLAAESRKFTPHVTLARLRDASPRAVADYLGLRGGPPGLSFRAEQFVIYSSRDSVGGGPYVLEAAYPLR